MTRLWSTVPVCAHLQWTVQRPRQRHPRGSGGDGLQADNEPQAQGLAYTLDGGDRGVVLAALQT